MKKEVITFKFRLDKFINALLYLIRNLEPMDKLRACKLLYLADKYHLMKYGRPIIGDRYKHMDAGQVPSLALDIMNDAQEGVCRSASNAQPDWQILFRKSFNFKEGEEHPKYEAKQEACMDVFSDSELEALDRTIRDYGPLSTSDIIKRIHRHATWKNTGQNDYIDYRLFVCRNLNLIKIMELEQVDREIEEYLNS